MHKTRLLPLMVLLVLTACVASDDEAEQYQEELFEAKYNTEELEGGYMYQVKLESSKGDVIIEVHENWAPIGAARFKELVESGFFDGARFFRVIDGFMVQFGLAADPAVTAKWKKQHLQDDPVAQSNERGMITFATAGPNSRTTQVFINFGNNERLNGMGFAPFGKVIEGMDVVDSWYSKYGEGAPQGFGPDQGRVATEGNAYLDKDFPELDYIIKATVISEGEADATP